VKDEDVTILAKVCYYTLGFVAYWFGSARFDMDGDGDFDAADVQAMINGGGKGLHLNFSRPPQNKEVQRKRKAAREKQKRIDDKEKAARAREYQATADDNVNTHGSIAGGIMNAGLNVMQAGDGIIDGATTIINADVEGEAEEDEIIENLKQFLPWFTIIEVVLILGLWGVFAFMQFAYSSHSSNSVITNAMVLKNFETDHAVYLDKCQQECNLLEECVGVAFKEGPFAECKLLSSLPDAGNQGFQQKVGCHTDLWYWRTYARQPWDLSVWLGTKGGLESWFPGQTALTAHRFCEDGFQWTFLYRWWSYQFTHGGMSHVGSNSFMTLVLGIPLEGLHGTGYFAIMWTVGVLGGACCWLLFDPYRTSFGASGGCFSLLGMHVADLVMNWSQKKFRYMLILMLLFVTGVELAGFWANHSEEGSLTAHCVHVGGVVAGLFIGVCVGRNVHEEKWEKIVQMACWGIGVLMVVLSLVWWFAANPFPAIRNLWDPSESPWCWIGQVCVGEGGTPCPAMGYDNSGSTSLDTQAVFDQCVYCQSRECVEGWYSKLAVNGVEGDSFAYCPRSWSWIDCNKQFVEDVWKDTFFYPPSTDSVGK
jgi:membrane associated rhomboid family serine protease